MQLVVLVALCAVFVFYAARPVRAATYPPPQENSFVLKNFVFYNGTSLPEMKVHYRTVGKASGEPVLVLHGTAGSGASMLCPSFAGELFGPGQPLDAAKYYLILPDAIGAGNTAKPSDGLRAAFPAYTYEDMVVAQYRLLVEALGIRHLRLIVGNSMGGMHAWLWAVNYPDFMDAIVPLAALPAAMSGRNWMLRRMIIDAVRNDPAWQGGNYSTQPQQFRQVNTWFEIATNGGALAYLAKAPSRAKADALLAEQLAKPTTMDANDFLFQWDASRSYNPAPKLARVKTRVLAVNSADDERNPVESGLLEQALRALPHASMHIIPASAATSGHATTMHAHFWKAQLAAYMQSLPPGDGEK